MSTISTILFSSTASTMLFIGITCVAIYFLASYIYAYLQPSLPKVSSNTSQPKQVNESGLHNAAEVVRKKAKEELNPEQKEDLINLAEKLEEHTARGKRKAWLDQVQKSAPKPETTSNPAETLSPPKKKQKTSLKPKTKTPPHKTSFKDLSVLGRILYVDETRLAYVRAEIEQLNPLDTSQADQYLQAISKQTDLETRIEKTKKRIENGEKFKNLVTKNNAPKPEVPKDEFKHMGPVLFQC